MNLYTAVAILKLNSSGRRGSDFGVGLWAFPRIPKAAALLLDRNGYRVSHLVNAVLLAIGSLKNRLNSYHFFCVWLNDDIAAFAFETRLLQSCHRGFRRKHLYPHHKLQRE